MIFGWTHSARALLRKWKKPHKRLISFSSSIAPILYRLGCVSGPSLGYDLHKTERGNRLQTSLVWDELTHQRGLHRSVNLEIFFFGGEKKTNLSWLQVGDGLERLSKLSSEWLSSFAVLLFKAITSKGIGSVQYRPLTIINESKTFKKGSYYSSCGAEYTVWQCGPHVTCIYEENNITEAWQAQESCLLQFRK